MRLAAGGKVAIEVGLNEIASKDENPHVPYGAEEVAAAAIAAARAGAAIVHFHARHADGRQAWVEEGISREVMERVAASGTDVLVYPSYVERLDHIWALAEDPPEGGRLEFTPFDPAQHVRRVLWDETAGRLGVVTFGPDDPHRDRPPYPPEIDRFATLGLVPNIAVFNAADLRWVALAARLGILRQPLQLKLFFSDRWVSNSEPAVEVLDFLLGRLPEGVDHESIVVPYAMNSAAGCELLLRAALERGLGVRVGIGDNPLAFPDRTNAELVEWASGLAAEYGFAPASADDVRARCGLALKGATR